MCSMYIPANGDTATEPNHNQGIFTSREWEGDHTDCRYVTVTEFGELL